VTFKPDVYGYDSPVLRELNLPTKLPALELPRTETALVVTEQGKL
jgi:hypothetical protein